jgi:hypothetical protein
MDCPVEKLLHSSVPVAVVDNMDEPSQLFTTVTTGAGGLVIGSDSPKPSSLVHPFMVDVTV